jgi:hypothetical protein
MSAMSAPRAFGTPSPATSPGTADLAPIRLPGSDRTYEHRDFLRGLGLRWDPVGHAWHGLLAAPTRQELETRFGLVPRVVRPIESFQEVLLTRKEEPEAGPASSTPAISIAPSPARHVVRDSSRTRFESRLAFADGDEGGDEPANAATETRRFSWFETTSGLPDDSREADERAAYRHLVDLRSCVKIARAIASRMPGLAAVLRARPDRAARFYARFGITEGQFMRGVPDEGVMDLARKSG